MKNKFLLTHNTVTPENVSAEEVVLEPYAVEDNSVESRTDANSRSDSAEYDSLKGILLDNDDNIFSSKEQVYPRE